MKKMVLGISMSLAALVFLVPSAMAASPPQGAPSLHAFLASLATPAPVTAAKRPAIQGKSLCTASATCKDSSTVNCSGNNSTTSCSAADYACPEIGHVTCDGVTTWCPNTTCIDCGALEQSCSWGCNPCNYNFSCDPSTGDWDCRCIFQGCPQ